MHAAAHALARVRSVPDAATDEILDGAYSGWDARVTIPAPGTDPFEGIDDDDLLHAHAGVIAATVLAQANQMRILDSAIVPDRDLVRPTLGATGKFNEFDVYTPTVLPERYAVINQFGVEEVVVPSRPFFPGVSDRASAAQPAVRLGLEEATDDPYATGIATATALLQIGIEAGYDVGPVADVLNKAWGLDDAFSPGTVVGMAGSHDYAALFAQDRNTDARRLASWQDCSYVRSGQLTMTASDWGPNLHCDFRRVRVAAESLFATSVAMEARSWKPYPTGKITYHVPSTSLLSANPAYLFFSDARPEIMVKQERCPAAKALLDKIDAVGVLRALWPSADPVIAATWAASFASPGGLALTPVEFIPRTVTTGPLFAAATSRLTRTPVSYATGMGRTSMTTLSARIATMAKGVVNVQTVAWLARFAAVIEIMRLTTSAATRATMAKVAWRSLHGDVAQDIERSTSNAHMAELKAMLPATLREGLPARSSKIPIFAMLLEVGNHKTQASHTVLRGLRYAFARARDVAAAVTLREKVGWRADHPHEWLARRVAVIREFWAVQYAALGQVAHVADELRTDLRWWIGVSAAVNTFRAGVMRGYDVEPDPNEATMFAGNVGIRCRPYHAAAHLLKTLTPYMARALPAFVAGENIRHWVYELSTVTAPVVQESVPDIPRLAKALATSDNTSHCRRGATLLATEDALGKWMDVTNELFMADCEALLEKRAEVVAAASGSTGAASSPEVVLAMLAAADAIAASMEKLKTAVPPTALFNVIESEVTDDAWDDFTLAVYDATLSNHAQAEAFMAAAKKCTSEAEAARIVTWIMETFSSETSESYAAIV